MDWALSDTPPEGQKPEQGFQLPYTGKSLAGMQDPVADRFQAMAGKYAELMGKPIRVDDAFRSHEAQAEGYREKPSLVAPPGHSQHELGRALDIDETQADELDRLGLLQDYGFHRPMLGEKGNKREPWHIEPAPDFEQKGSGLVNRR